MSIFRNINSSSLIEEINLTGFYRGKIAKVFQILGRRTTFANNTSFHDLTDITSANNLFPSVTSAESLEVVSSSANDTNAGTGVNSVSVIYIDSSNNLATANITMNGTTPVAAGFTANEIISMESQTVGSNLVAVGTITLRKVTGAIQLEQITAGGNRSLSAKFMIPSGYSGYLVGGNFAAISQTQDFRLRATVNTFDRSLSNIYKFQHNYFLSSGANSGDLTFDFMKLPQLARVKVSTITGTTTSNPRADCTFSVVIIQN